MHIVTLADLDFFDLLYIKVIQNLQYVSIEDFSLNSFARWAPVRGGRLAQFLFFPLSAFVALLSSRTLLLRNCVLRLLTGDISLALLVHITAVPR